MSSKATSRYGFIDSIRGIAACLVVVQHSLYASLLLGGDASAHLTGFIPRLLELGETGVVAFFLVSGFVIPLSLEKTNNFKIFWLHRALRIYPLYLLVYGATLAVMLGGGLRGLGGLAANFAAHLLFIQEYIHQPNFVGGSWTLSLEAVWYVGISGLLLLSFNRKTNLIAAAAVAVSLLADLACIAGHHVPMGRLSMLVCCVLGLVAYRRDREDISARHFAWLFAILAATIFVNLLIGIGLYPGPNPTSTFPEAPDSWALAFAIFFVPYFTRKSPAWNHGVLAFLGRNSYSIYLIHPIVIYLLDLTPVRGVATLLIVPALTIVLANFTYRFVESPPIRFGHSFRPVKAAPALAQS